MVLQRRRRPIDVGRRSPHYRPGHPVFDRFPVPAFKGIGHPQDPRLRFRFHDSRSLYSLSIFALSSLFLVPFSALIGLLAIFNVLRKPRNNIRFSISSSHSLSFRSSCLPTALTIKSTSLPPASLTTTKSWSTLCSIRHIMTIQTYHSR
jgi:hypothetical protein